MDRWSQRTTLEKIVFASVRLTAIALAVVAMLAAAPVSALAADAGARGPSVGARPVTGPWTGSVSIWRSSAFASQATTSWCTAAATQMMLNLVLDRSRTSATEQRGDHHVRAGERQPRRLEGLGPAGLGAAMRHFGTSRTSTYHWERHGSYAAALRAAAYDLRMTGKPVGLLVLNGKHANVLVGFTATSDPALGGNFTVTSAQIVGPWYPRPNVDPAPGTWLSSASLASRFTRYAERDGLADWVGYWVIVTP